jgi:hypothetical protein
MPTGSTGLAKRGRPTKFSPKLAGIICARLIAGESLRRMCEDNDMPDASTVGRNLSEPLST